MPISGGTTYTLAASGARTSGANGTAQTVDGWRRAICLLNITASAHEAGDTLDVYVDISPDAGTTWINAIHFTQQAGNGAAKKEVAILDPSNPGTSVIVVTSDAASAAVRPAVWGNQIRARWAIADSGDADQSHTFSVTAFVW